MSLSPCVLLNYDSCIVGFTLTSFCSQRLSFISANSSTVICFVNSFVMCSADRLCCYIYLSFISLIHSLPIISIETSKILLLYWISYRTGVWLVSQML